MVEEPRSLWTPVLAALIGVLLLSGLWGLFTNPNIRWDIVGNYLFDHIILGGLLVTLQLSALAVIFGLILGIFVAIASMSKNQVLSRTAAGYVWLFRGLPAMVQLLIWGNIALFVREINIGIPFTDITWITIPVNSYITPFVAAVLGLSLAESAYISEIIRGGISSIDKGQFEASSALGMSRGRAMRRIVLPQALKAIIPPLGNQFVGMVKASALVSVIAGGDLLTEAQNIAGQNYRTMEMLFVASFWYLVVLVVINFFQGMLERKMRRSER